MSKPKNTITVHEVDKSYETIRACDMLPGEWFVNRKGRVFVAAKAFPSQPPQLIDLSTGLSVKASEQELKPFTGSLTIEVGE